MYRLTRKPGMLFRTKTLFFVLFSNLLAVQFLVPTGGDAQQVDHNPPAEAVKLYEQGRKNYEAGRYREAVDDLKAALELDPDSPNLVYNVARVSELLGELSEAIHYYRRYLSLLSRSETAERVRIKKILRRLKGAKGDLQASPSETELLSTEQSSEATDPLFWATAGTGAALLVGGVVMGALALDAFDDTSNFVVGRDGSLNKRNSLASEAKLFGLFSDIGFISGGVLIAGAGLLFFLRQPVIQPKESQLPVDVGFDGRSAWLRFSGNL